MFWLIILIILIIFCFGGVLLFGAPYLPTLKQQVNIALDLAELKEEDLLLELGCGDGKVLIAAAKRGINVIGYELNPILAFIAWIRTRRYRKNVRVICADFWRVKWPPANAIFVFLLPKYMSKLDKKITSDTEVSVKLISFAFRIPNREPDSEISGVYLYKYS